MNIKFLTASAAIGFAAILAFSAAKAAAPGMSSSWQETTLDDKECLQNGERAIRAAGFSKNFEIVGHSVFGERGDYTGLVRCGTDKGFVIFVVSGPRGAECNKFREMISNKF